MVESINRPEGWQLDDGGYERDKFYTGGTDAKGHNERVWSLKVQPWLKDLMERVCQEIPAYKGQHGNLARNALTHQVRYDIERLDDPKLRDLLMREFRLHADMEDQARHLQRYAEMQRYVSSCAVALPIYASSGNWMMVTREIEKMKKNVEDGVLWEPCTTDVQKLIDEYAAKLKQAGK